MPSWSALNWRQCARCLFKKMQPKLYPILSQRSTSELMWRSIWFKAGWEGL